MELSNGCRLFLLAPALTDLIKPPRRRYLSRVALGKGGMLEECYYGLAIEMRCIVVVSASLIPEPLMTLNSQ